MVEIKENVTYLFGAGASASPNALPLNDELLNRMESTLLRNTHNLPNSILFLNHVEELINKAKKYGSIDTYAWICYENNKIEELNILKKIVWLYFTLEFRNSKLDSRYIKLLTKICIRPENGIIRLKPNINILTWNYDLQLEEAILEIEQSIKLTEDKSSFLLNAFPNMYFLINNIDENSKIPREEDGGIIHLNGIAGYLFNKNSTYADFIHDLNDENKITRYNELNTDTSNGKYKNIGDSIKFGWENKGTISNYLRQFSSKIASNTEHLVIVGYSFPDINREIDENIISNLKSLKSITFQTNDSLAEKRLNDIINKYSIQKNIEISIIRNYNEFYLPLK